VTKEFRWYLKFSQPKLRCLPSSTQWQSRGRCSVLVLRLDRERNTVCQVASYKLLFVILCRQLNCVIRGVQMHEEPLMLSTLTACVK